jgi:hypothetical protein
MWDILADQPVLGDFHIHDHLTAACQIFRFITTYFPVMKLSLQVIEALAWNLKKIISPPARHHFHGLTEKNNVIEDLPTSFVLPQLRDTQALAVDDDEDGSSQRGDEISRLVERWSALTVD